MPFSHLEVSTPDSPQALDITLKASAAIMGMKSGAGLVVRISTVLESMARAFPGEK